MPNCVNWFFGRGLSVGCNLTWSVPNEWKGLEREEQVDLIKAQLREEMCRSGVDCTAIQTLLKLLAAHTSDGWRHRFITTNWDYLLQREISNLDLKVRPPWLDSTHVFHINGTVECLPDNSNRSPFLLEEDSGTQRVSTLEADTVYNKMIWDKYFVVVGMSFECETDKYLLNSLGRVEEDLPIGDSSWVVINPDQTALARSCKRIKAVLPHNLVSVKPVQAPFSDWLNSGPRELGGWGALAF